ncbi:hypothetical protein PCE31107_02934 [Pandoraea cepalis]|uniref:Uncharacterized protein n=2 Tax=Pandoraea TaxID=93217 RepID=A0A5E4XEK6_9BURK|nr:hypothetical protein PCE31107_02934 [Pandoraea cepalis]VVE34558.1 hypothetical protein PTE31013_03855 [Pandoraea terrigena]
MQTQVSEADILAFKTTAGSRLTGCPSDVDARICD